MSTHISRKGVETAQTLEGIEAQILQNKKDLPAAIIANQNAGAGAAEQGAAAISGAFAFVITV